MAGSPLRLAMDVAPALDGLAGHSAIVVGGGFGGLSTACDLAEAGASPSAAARSSSRRSRWAAGVAPFASSTPSSATRKKP